MVSVSGRSEDVAATATTPPNTLNVMHGVVLQRTFLGPSTRLTIKLTAGVTLNADQRGISTLHPGARLYVGWNPEDGIVLPG